MVFHKFVVNASYALAKAQLSVLGAKTKPTNVECFQRVHLPDEK
jgi:hypothetical protein